MKRNQILNLDGTGIMAVSHVITCAFLSPQGVIPTAQRAAIVVGVELPVYDITKKHLIGSGMMGDTIMTHFM